MGDNNKPRFSPLIDDVEKMTLVMEGEEEEEEDEEETISMVEEVEEKIYLMAEEKEVPISGEEVTASITVIMHEAGPTTGHRRTNSGIMTMFLQVTKDTDRISERW